VPLPQLAGKRVLVVEDDYLVAMEIARALERAGAEVIGPAPTVEAALDALEQTAPDGAILDINQGRKLPSRWPTHSWPVASRLFLRRGMISSRFAHVKRCEKPMASEPIASALFG
jgi:hypothetical protein